MADEILFMGTPEFSVPILKSLSSNYKILSVFTQPPKKKSRGQKTIKSPIHLEAEKLKIPVRSPENLDNESDYKEMMAMILTITSSSFEQKRTPLERLAAAMLTMVGGETRRDSI